MSDDILSKVIAASDLGKVENTGLLSPAEVSRFVKDTNWENEVRVYREFKPTRDEIEYTVYFRAPIDDESVKFRCDWVVDCQDLEALDLEGFNLESALAFALKQACRQTQRRQTLIYRRTGVLPARQSADILY